MPAPRGISVRVQWAGIRACASGVSPSHEVADDPALSQWHRDTPLESLTVAGAAQELLRLKSETGGRAPVSRLTPSKKIERGTRERARILTHRLAKQGVQAPEPDGFRVAARWRAARTQTYAKAHSKKFVSS